MRSRKIEFDYSPKTKPLKHQVEAIQYLKEHDNVPFFDEQGLGKTKAVIDALCDNMECGVIDAVLVVAKKSLTRTWEDEILKHSRLFPIVIEGNRNKRGKRFLTFGHFYIISYATLRNEVELIRLLLKQQKFAIVLDESHTIKNPDSQTCQALLELRELPIKRIIITGTPIANRPEDLWSQFFFLDGGERFGTDFGRFREEYSIDLREDLSSTEGRFAILKQKIEEVAIRRTKDVLELPGKVYRDVHVELHPIQESLYENAKNDLIDEIGGESLGADSVEIDNYLVKLLRLTQIASNPSLILSAYEETPCKFLKLDTLLEGIVSKGEKAIVWTSFRQNIRDLRRRYREYSPVIIYGDVPIETRHANVRKFMLDENCGLLIANPSAAKEGLTLTAANNAIYLDRSFKMDDYLQSQDRIHRISQTKKCTIMKIIAENTIDEYTDEILERKQAVARYALSDRESIETAKSHFTKEDLIRILG